MQPDSLLQKLRNGELVYGTCLIARSPLWFNAIKGAKLDFVFLDTEHVPANREDLSLSCQHLRDMGVTPVVRVPQPDPFLACQALDAGARGIVAPYIESAAQVRALAGAVKYRPLKGEKLDDLLSGREVLTDEMRRYLDGFNRGNLLIANIESAPAIRNLDGILAEPGLDGVFIGPHDLSVSLGVPEQYDHPDFERAVATIVTKVRAAGKHVGIQFWMGPEIQLKWIKLGLNMVIHSNDLTLFKLMLENDISAIRNGAVR
ncbi:2-keto-3-deoxy-L-rhamnonate aldolase [Ravibacter arvi]|uniref:2-keto-3-deoxy-L-rhamnonate aldolase n=1 Tax=Ravibacter arvi TaxID=2051041 RepID=A0ABP8M8S7_9BACT